MSNNGFDDPYQGQMIGPPSPVAAIDAWLQEGRQSMGMPPLPPPPPEDLSPAGRLRRAAMAGGGYVPPVAQSHAGGAPPWAGGTVIGPDPYQQLAGGLPPPQDPSLVALRDMADPNGWRGTGPAEPDPSVRRFERAAAGVNSIAAEEQGRLRALASRGGRRRADPLAGVPRELLPELADLYYADPDAYRAKLAEARAIGAQNEARRNDPFNDPAMGGEGLGPQPGGITGGQHAALAKRFDAFEGSALGLTGRIEREQLAGAGERGKLAMGAVDAERYALEDATAARAEAAEEQQRLEQQREVYRVRYRQEQDRRLADVEKLTAETQKTEIDPDRFWNRRHPVANVFSILGLALGGLGQGWSDGKLPNTALQMLQANIDRDIDAQKASLANKRAAIAEKRTIYGMARERFGDDEMALQYAKAELTRQTEQAVVQFAAGARTEALKAEAGHLASQLGEDTKVYKLNVQLRARTIADEQARRAAGVARPKMPGVKALKPEDQARYVDGKGFYANEKIAAKVKSAIASKRHITQVFDKMIRNVRDNAQGIPGTKASATYASDRVGALMAMKEAGKAGALDKGLIEVAQEGIPEAGLFSFDENSIARLEAQKNLLLDQLDQAERSELPLKGEIGFETTDKGEHKPVYRYDPTMADPATVTPTSVGAGDDG